MFRSFLKPLFRDASTFVMDLLFPIRCLICETEGPNFICTDCRPLLSKVDFQICIVCKKPSLGGLTHPHCQSPHMADGLVSVYDYHDPRVSDILIKGKYSFLPEVYKQLAEMIANVIKKDFPFLLTPNTHNLIPVPLHWMRQNWRGFNQSKVLAESVANVMGLQALDALRRKKITKTQKNLKREERIKNVESAFSILPHFPKANLKGASFILVDDVTTTGSTLLEAAKVLKRNGAQKVFCLTVARD